MEENIKKLKIILVSNKINNILIEIKNYLMS